MTVGKISIYYPSPRRQRPRPATTSCVAPPATAAGANADAAGHPSRSEDATQRSRTEKIWIAPSASVASRRPAKRSRGAFRGAMVNPRTRREIVFESTLERDLAYILTTMPSVVEVRDQVGPVEYVDTDGVVRQHTLDFVADLEDGTRTAFAVKPARRVGPSGIGRTLELIRDQRPGVADRFVVRTGDHITRDRAANARLLHRALRGRDEAHIADVKAVASTLRGCVAIHEILAASRDPGQGFMAVACLIADGVLEHVGPGRLSIDSFVRPRRTTGTNH